MAWNHGHNNYGNRLRDGEAPPELDSFIFCWLRPGSGLRVSYSVIPFPSCREYLGYDCGQAVDPDARSLISLTSKLNVLLQ